MANDPWAIVGQSSSDQDPWEVVGPAQANKSSSEEVPKKTSETMTLGDVGKGIMRGLAGVSGAAGQAGEFVGEATGIKGLQEVGKDLRRAADERQQMWTESMTPAGREELDTGKIVRGLSRIPSAIEQGWKMGVGGAARLVGEGSIKSPVSPDVIERIRAKNPSLAAKIEADWRDKPTLPEVSKWGGDLYAKARKEAQSTTPEDQSFAEEAIVSAGQSVGQALPAIGVAALTRNPVAAGTAIFGGQETARAYGEARDKGLKKEDAVPYAIRNGLIEAGTERFSIGALFKKEPSFGKKIVNFLAREIPGENVAEISQEVNSILSGVSPKTTVGEFISSLPRMIALTTASTILGGGAQAGIVHGAQSIAGKMRGQVRPDDSAQSAREPEISDEELINEIKAAMGEDDAARQNVPPSSRDTVSPVTPGNVSASQGEETFPPGPRTQEELIAAIRKKSEENIIAEREKQLEAQRDEQRNAAYADLDRKKREEQAAVAEAVARQGEAPTAMEQAFAVAKKEPPAPARAASVQPDILPKSGIPFKTQKSANLFARSNKIAGHEPVNVGVEKWVLRPITPEQTITTEQEAELAALLRLKNAETAQPVSPPIPESAPSLSPNVAQTGIAGAPTTEGNTNAETLRSDQGQMRQGREDELRQMPGKVGAYREQPSEQGRQAANETAQEVALNRPGVRTAVNDAFITAKGDPATAISNLEREAATLRGISKDNPAMAGNVAVSENAINDAIAYLMGAYPESQQSVAKSETPPENAVVSPKLQSAAMGTPAKPKAKPAISVNPAKDSLIVAMAKLGGLDATEAEAQGIDPAYFKRKGGAQSGVFGKPWIRRADGRTFDEMAELLDQYGYFPQGTSYGPNELLDLIDRELGGDKVYTPAGFEAKAERDHEERLTQEDIKNIGLLAEEAYDDPSLLHSLEAIESLPPNSEIYTDEDLDAIIQKESAINEERSGRLAEINASIQEGESIAAGGQKGEETKGKPGPINPETVQRANAQSSDLLGDDTIKAQSVADAARKKDEKGAISGGASIKPGVISADQGQMEAPYKTVARQMLEVIADDPLSDYGVRVIPGEYIGHISVGDILPHSKVWNNGSETNIELPGVSVAKINKANLESIMRAIENIGAHGKPGPNGYYFGDRVALVKGENNGIGEDVGESIFLNPVVAGMWKKPTKGNTEVEPNHLGQDARKARAVSDSIRVAIPNVVEKMADAVSKLADKVEAIGREGTQSSPKTEAESAIQSMIKSHDSFMGRVRDGAVTAEEFKLSFDVLVSNRDAVLAELSKETKQALLDRLGSMKAYRAKNEKKAYAVDNAYEEMLTDYLDPTSTGGAFSYGYTPGDRFGGITKAVAARVERTTDEDIKQHAKDVAARREEREKQREENLAGLDDPKTIEDFRRLMRARQEEIGEGATFQRVRMTLTPDQREQYDTLVAEENRRKRESAKPDVTARAPSETVSTSEIIKTRHTKHGHDLWQFSMEQRVSADEFKSLVEQAKRLGGNYSSYRGNGAIPGWQFRTEDAAKAFKKLVAGDAADANEVIQERRNAFADDRSQSAVERLREMADSLDVRADDALGSDRKVNTSRRARMAASAEAAANGQKAMAQTMRNIANAIEDGSAKFLDRVRQKIQVEELRSILNTAKYDRLRATYPTYAEQEKHRHDPLTKEVADYAEFPAYTMYRSDLAGLGRAMIENEGTKKIGQQIMKVADDVTDAYLTFAKENLGKVSRFTKASGGLAVFKSKADAEKAITRSNINGDAVVLPIKRGENVIIMSPSAAMKHGIWQGDGDKRITLASDVGEGIVEKLGREQRHGRLSAPHQFVSAYDKRKRLSGMGIEAPSELRAALREFIGLAEAPKQADKIKEMERAMIGRRNDGLDFFPTPAGVADEMIAAADIREGMSVLEPSAGMGHIAERIRETGVDPDVVEISSSRRELLEAKGFNLVGNDFMDTGGSYDRIIMNPPFGDRRDAEHVRHAYSLLKPGGRLVAIMGEGVFFGGDKKAKDFRDWMEQVGATDEKLEEGTFLDPSLPVTTGVNARMVVIDKESADGGSSSLYSRDTSIVNAEKSRGPDTHTVDSATQAILSAHAGKEKAAIQAMMDAGIVKVVTADQAAAIIGYESLFSKDGLNRKAPSTDAFKNWSGKYLKSRAVGVFYHKTRADFTSFDPDRRDVGWHFGTLEQAEGLSRLGDAPEGTNIMPVRLSIKNPLRLKDSGSFNADGIAKQLANKGIISKDVANKIIADVDADWKSKTKWNTVVREKIQDAGYDGIVYKNEHEGYGDSWIAFEQTQIKSAIGNIGTYDTENPDILKSKEGHATKEISSRTVAFFNPADGTTYFIADHMRAGMTPEQVRKLTQHEISVHALHLGKDSKEFKSILSQVELMRKAGNKAVIAAHQRAVDAGTREANIPEESLAYLIEQNPDLPIIKRVIAWMRNAIREIGRKMPVMQRMKLFAWADGLTVDDLLWMAQTALARSYKAGGIEVVTENSGSVLASKESREGEDTERDVKSGKIETGGIIGDRFTLPAETRAEQIRRKIQDDAIRIQKVQEAVLKQGGEITEDSDIAKAIKLYPGRLASRIHDLNKKIVDPLLERMTKAGITMDDVGLYKYAMHAKERNAEIAKIRKDLPNDGKPGNSGSGMTDATADEIIKQAEAHPSFKSIKQSSDILDKLMDSRLNFLVKEGVMSKDQADAYREKYKHYVPLKGFENADVNGVPQGTGRGMSTGRKIDFRALGRQSMAKDVFQNIIRDTETAMMLAEKAMVGKVARAFVLANPDVKLWSVDKIPKDRYFKKGREIHVVYQNGEAIAEFRKEGADKAFIKQLKSLYPGEEFTVKIERENGLTVLKDSQFNENEEIMFIDGSDVVRIQFTDPLITRAYNRLWNNGVSDGLKTLNAYNGLLRQMYTQKNPAFFILNAFRDVQAVVPYLTGELGAKLAFKAMGNMIGAKKAAWNFYHQKPLGPVWTDVMNRFSLSGGSVGFSYVGDIEAKTIELEGTLSKYTSWKNSIANVKKGNIKRGMYGVLVKALNSKGIAWIEALNSSFENMSRLATFKAAIDSGLSDKDAAMLAKHVTVNFNARGEWGPNMNAVWLFSNASIQGSRNIGHALLYSKHKGQVWSLAGGLMALGILAGLIGDDEDDLIRGDERGKALVFKFGDSTIKWPMPYGWGFFGGMGQLLAQSMKHPESHDKIAVEMADLTMQHFGIIGNPFAGGSNDLIGAVNLLPTLPKPFAQAGANRSSFGGQLYPESPFDETTPDSEKAWRATKGSGYDMTAKWLNDISGGDRAQEGFISVSPESLKLGVTAVSGGVGRLLTDLVSLPFKATSDESMSTKDFPILKNFVGEIGSDEYKKRFYDQSSKAKEEYQTYKKYQKLGDTDSANAYMAENNALISVGRMVNGYQKQLKALRDYEDHVKNDASMPGDRRATELKIIERKVINLTKEFNSKFKGMD